MTTLRARIQAQATSYTHAALQIATLSCLLSLSGVSQAQTTTPGSVAGQFSVSQNGAATYSLPIQVPPGVTGLQPQLSVNYNSQDGHGLAGVGWSLGGLSVITRCEATKASDGRRGIVNLDNNDRYCLEGQKLMAFMGSYGQDGTEYRTEIDKFSKIVSYGSAGNGPASFKVWTKGGQIMEYGNTADSRVINTGYTTARQWSLNRISDTTGNTMTVSYFNNPALGLHLPQQIWYGGNPSPGAGTVANRRVDIAYLDRPDKTTAYVGNQKAQEWFRISKISTYIDTNPIKNYNFTYETSPSTNRSRLSQITECDGAGTTCLKPVIFSYNDMDKTALQIVAAGHGGGDAGNRLVDLFGDGRPVYYTHNTAGQHFASRLNADVNQNQHWTWSGHGVSDAGWDIVDIFGDGKPVYWTHDAAGNHYASRFTENNATPQHWWWTQASGKGGHGVGSSGEKLFADIFGDGHPVYYTRSGDTHYASRFKSDGSVQNFVWSNTGVGDCHAQGLVDLFGEGRQVFWMRCGPNSRIHTAIQFNENGTVTPYYWDVVDGVDIYAIQAGGGMVDAYESGRQVHWARTGANSSVHIITQLNKDGTYATKQFTGDPDGLVADWRFADLFGDGHKVYWTQQGFTHKAVRMNKDGTVEKWSWQGHGRGSDGWRLADLFGDGHAVYWTHTGTTHSITRMSPDAAPNNVQSWQFEAGGTGDSGWDFADLYGDGRQVYWTRNGFNHFVSSFARGEFDNLKTVTGSTGLKQAPTYTSLNQTLATPIYAPDTGTADPKKDIRFPMRVVTKVDTDTGLGGTSSSVYSYGGLKSEPNTGRGFLGFRWMLSKDATTNVETYSEFNQNWPYIGMLKTSETRLAGGGFGPTGLLKRSSVTPACLNFNFTPCAVAPATDVPGYVYFPYTSQTVDETWDLNGTVLPTVTTNYQYGTTAGDNQLFGNPTQITATTTLGASSKTVTTVNEYKPADATNWILGRLLKSTVTNSKVGAN
jgi:hypothetical protein